MLELRNIRKEYRVGQTVTYALKGISIAFRDNEFVAILGQSGCGKTTLLNIIGGLDRYTSGEFVIDGTSTAGFRDSDWDAYRNSEIGFVFQSYNLIQHQTVLANVELALKLSNRPAAERRKLAMAALEEVGLAEHAHKKPAMLSGGQMQRVALARALVNNPRIILADEPTGALDSKTSIQVMDMLAEVARDRVVIMVTHNPELAERYATRIVNLKDGEIVGDSDPVPESELPSEGMWKPRKSKLRMRTALGLSMSNLVTKKGRTLLTSFAGAIGIIGIALITSLSSGVNDYIEDVQRKTMMSYPITIASRTMDFSSMLEMSGMDTGILDTADSEPKEGIISADNSMLEGMQTMGDLITENNLTKFKKYLDDPSSEIHRYLRENGISYSYESHFAAYAKDTDGNPVSVDGSDLEKNSSSQARAILSRMTAGSSSFALGSFPSSSSSSAHPSCMTEMMSSPDGLVADAVQDGYEVLAGSWPSSWDELVLVVDASNSVPVETLKNLGLISSEWYDETVEEIQESVEASMYGNGESKEIEILQQEVDIKSAVGHTISVVPACDLYEKDGNGLWKKKVIGKQEARDLIGSGMQARISAVVRKNGDDSVSIPAPVGYTRAFADKLREYGNASQAVSEQLASKDRSIFTGLLFDARTDDEKAADARRYIEMLGISSRAGIAQTAMAWDAAGRKDDDGGADGADGSSEKGKSDTVPVDRNSSDDAADTYVTDSEPYARQDEDERNIEGAVDSVSAIASLLESGDASQLMSLMGGGQDASSIMSMLGDGSQLDDAEAEALMSMLGGGQLDQSALSALAGQSGGSSSGSPSASDIQSLMSLMGGSSQSQPGGTAGASALAQLYGANGESMKKMMEMMGISESAIPTVSDGSEQALSDWIMARLDDRELMLFVYDTFLASSKADYEDALTDLGWTNIDTPDSISIYAGTFEDKEGISECIERYNEGKPEEDKITYTDYVALLTSSVTTIIDAISYVLIAFVAISLIVSSIMIAIITYISVLERTKEIGVLRSLGTSKRDVSKIFNAETLIEGFISGVLGVGIAVAITFPANDIVNSLLGIERIAHLPWQAGAILICISVALTLAAGFIPSRMASKKDPAVALRTE